jgi:hypothetical protein
MIQHILKEYELDPKWAAHHVTTEDMDYFFLKSRAFGDSSTEDLIMNFYADVVVVERRFGVTITVLDTEGNLALPSVKISGMYENVFACVSVVWGGNEDAHSMRNYVGMLIGDKEAADRWNSGA